MWPSLRNWKVFQGSIVGRVFGHPNQKKFPDGKRITTSMINTAHTMSSGDLVVMTVSGSRYRLDQNTSEYVGFVLKLWGSGEKVK